ncbi:MAG: hypothetical protein FWF44_00585 [Defluviitaleaceae bacterium]|nr:hypothetical protein [Defluviitaleaceae bacterium]
MTANTVEDRVDIMSAEAAPRGVRARPVKAIPRTTAPAAPGPSARPALRDAAPAKKRRSKVAPVVVVLAVAAAIAAAMIFDVFGMRSRYVVPALERVPFLRNILPQTQTDGQTTAELTARIDSLTAQLARSQQDVQALTDANGALTAQNDGLKVYEAQQNQFESDKADFDAMVAMNDPQAYADFYAKIAPANAEKLYTQAVGIVAQTADEKKYAKLIAGMDSAAAAAALEALIPTDMSLVVSVLRNMDSAAASAILNEMQTANAAVTAKMLAP